MHGAQTTMLAYSNPPTNCQTCYMPIKEEFFDMRTHMGPWANMCYHCAFHQYGIGQLGTGYGQHYKKREDGIFYKLVYPQYK